jgi:hypothetical protein
LVSSITRATDMDILASSEWSAKSHIDWRLIPSASAIRAYSSGGIPGNGISFYFFGER